jgi:hypothetical protein
MLRSAATKHPFHQQNARVSDPNFASLGILILLWRVSSDPSRAKPRDLAFDCAHSNLPPSSRRDGRLVRPRRAQLGSEIICLAKARKAQFKKLSRDCHAEEQSDEASLSAVKNANAPSKLRSCEETLFVIDRRE